MWKVSATATKGPPEVDLMLTVAKSLESCGAVMQACPQPDCPAQSPGLASSVKLSQQDMFLEPLSSNSCPSVPCNDSASLAGNMVSKLMLQGTTVTVVTLQVT